MSGLWPLPWLAVVDERPELQEDADDSIPDVDQLEDRHWSFPVAKGYLDGRVWLHHHLRVRRRDSGHYRDLCGVIVASAHGERGAGFVDDIAVDPPGHEVAANGQTTRLRHSESRESVGAD